MITNLSPLMKSVIAICWLLLIGAVTVMSSGADVNFDLSKPGMDLFLKIGQVVSVILVFVVPSLMFALFFSSERLRFLKLNRWPAFVTLLLVMLLMMGASPLIAFTEQINKQMELPGFMAGLEEWMKMSENRLKELTEAFLSGTTVSSLIINLFVIAFMAAISEELFFRGVLQGSLTEWTKNVHVAIWVSAILFSAFHMQFYGFLPRMLLGALLGYFYVWSGSLWLPIWAHFVNNGAAVVLVFLSKRGTISEETANSEAGVGLTLVSAILTALFLYGVYRFEKKRQAAHSIPEQGL